jgi:hypothetical protein
MRETDRRDFNKHGRDTMVNEVWIQLEFDFGVMETIDQSLNMRQA